MIPCWEVDENGQIIEHYLYSKEEIDEARENGRIIVDFPWGEGFFQPRFDLDNNNWVESMQKEEIDKIVNEEILRGQKARMEEYLQQTDWYVIRNMESGKKAPTEVITERQRCRDEISRINLLLGV